MVERRLRRHDRRTMRNAEASCSAILKHGDKLESVVMVGVGSGVESSVFKEQLGDIPVYGIEAHPAAAKAVKGIMDVTHAAVVGDSALESVSFYLRRGKSMASSIHSRGSSSDKEIEVPAITLDRFFEDKQLQGKRTWLYMDCEGCELGAVQGGELAIKFIDWIQLEVKATYCSRTTWPLSDQVLPYIESKGFELVNDYRRTRGGRAGNGDVLLRRIEQ